MGSTPRQKGGTSSFVSTLLPQPTDLGYCQRRQTFRLHEKFLSIIEMYVLSVSATCPGYTEVQEHVALQLSLKESTKQGWHAKPTRAKPSPAHSRQSPSHLQRSPKAEKQDWQKCAKFCTNFTFVHLQCVLGDMQILYLQTKTAMLLKPSCWSLEYVSSLKDWESRIPIFWNLEQMQRHCWHEQYPSHNDLRS